MSGLLAKHCQVCETGIGALSSENITEHMKALHSDWTVSHDEKRISRTFTFKNYFRTMSFVNAVAHIANQEGHHPDMSVHYNKCIVEFSTHAIDGLSENDFICAAKVDQLL